MVFAIGVTNLVLYLLLRQGSLKSVRTLLGRHLSLNEKGSSVEESVPETGATRETYVTVKWTDCKRVKTKTKTNSKYP